MFRPVPVVAVQLLLRQRRAAVGPMRFRGAGHAGHSSARSCRSSAAPASSPAQSCDTSGFVKRGICGPAVCPASVSPGRVHGGDIAGRKVRGRRHIRQGRCVRRHAVGAAASFPNTPRLTGGGVTALSFDRNDDLWVAQNGDDRHAAIHQQGRGLGRVRRDRERLERRAGRRTYRLRRPARRRPDSRALSRGHRRRRAEFGPAGLDRHAPVHPDLHVRRAGPRPSGLTRLVRRRRPDRAQRHGAGTRCGTCQSTGSRPSRRSPRRT